MTELASHWSEWQLIYAFYSYSPSKQRRLRFSCVDGGSAATKIIAKYGRIVGFEEASTATSLPAD